MVPYPGKYAAFNSAPRLAFPLSLLTDQVITAGIGDLRDEFGINHAEFTFSYEWIYNTIPFMLSDIYDLYLVYIETHIDQKMGILEETLNEWTQDVKQMVCDHICALTPGDLIDTTEDRLGSLMSFFSGFLPDVLLPIIVEFFRFTDWCCSGGVARQVEVSEQAGGLLVLEVLPCTQNPPYRR